MPSVFFSYSHADEPMRDQIEKQLAMLKRQGAIETWHDRRIPAGENIDHAIDEHINQDDIILLLVSADFIASEYCYAIEMTRALERHQSGDAIVIPVILRACDWHHAPFGKLNAVPRDGIPISQWPDLDDALLQVARAVREAATRHGTRGSPATPSAKQATKESTQVTSSAAVSEPRSSNLRLAKAFTQRDKDAFQEETFEYIARFFENSLAELGERNAEVEGVFRRVAPNRFFASVYRHGEDITRMTIFTGNDFFGGGICCTQGETTESNTMNESIQVDADDQTLFLKSFGMTTYGSGRDQKLSQEGAAELFWELLIQPLQSASRR